MFNLFRSKPQQESAPLENFVLSGREIDLRGGQVVWNGETNVLQPASVRALLFLVTHKDRWVSANEIWNELRRDLWSHRDFGLKPEEEIQRVIAALKRSLQDGDSSVISRRIDDRPPFTESYRLFGSIC